MALIIEVNGRMEDVIDKAAINDLTWLQKTVGGYIELFHFRQPVEFNGQVYNGMVLNELGKLENQPFNQLATMIAKAGGLSPDDCIVGNVVAFNRVNTSGDIE